MDQRNKVDKPPAPNSGANNRNSAAKPGNSNGADKSPGAASSPPRSARTPSASSKGGDEGRLPMARQNDLSMFTKHVTKSGSFQVHSDWLEPLWNILQALPAGVLVVDRSHEIAFANEVCLRLLQAEGNLQGKYFTSLFCDSGDALKAEKIAAEVYTATTPRTVHAQIIAGAKRIWARLHYRSLRLVHDRCVLILIENLTAERDQLELIQQHQEELIKTRAKLDASNAQLLKEIEESQKAQVKIERAKREWERTFDAVPDLISIVDRNHRIARVNRALADRLGKSYEDILGAECNWIRHGQDAMYEQCPHVELMKDGKPHRAELTDKYLGGDFDVAVSPLHDEDGRLMGSVHVARDITDVKKALQLVLESGRARVVAELAGMVAHSFNNLLQTAMGGTQLCLTNLELGNYPDVKSTLEGLLEDLRVGARTVRRLTLLARVGGPPSLQEHRTLDFSAAVHQALDMCSPWWKTLPQQAGIRITLKRDLGPDCIVKGSLDQLLELVVDLVKNAAEALPEGGTIEVKTTREEERIILTVRDNGIGIAEEDLDKVFQPLWSTKGPSSAGMGLKRVKKAVERHGGRVFLASRPNLQTAATVILPAAKGGEEKAVGSSLDEPGPALRILLVDDLEAVAKVLAEGLEQVGHKVHSCLSCPRALEVYKLSPVDIVICDLGMPDMNGWQMAKALQEIAREKNRPRTPFILVTGWGAQPLQEEMMAKYGVDYVLEKPVELNELTRTIRRIMNQNQQDS